MNGRKVFYRKAGNCSRPAIILLQGFPSSGATIRSPISMLADGFDVIAPNYICLASWTRRPPRRSRGETMQATDD